MEDIEKKEDIEETETDSEDTSTEDQNTDESDDESEDIDYKKELENVQNGKKERSEIEKAERALHFNIARYKELGGDPAKFGVVEKKEEAKDDDIDAKIDKRFAAEEARRLTRSEDEYRLVMHYVENVGLSVEDAHLLANKGRIKKAVSEAKRSNVQYGQPVNAKRERPTTVPTRNPDEVALLARRGMHFNPTTKTYQGKFYEEYWDGTSWMSRKLKK